MSQLEIHRSLLPAIFSKGVSQTHLQLDLVLPKGPVQDVYQINEWDLVHEGPSTSVYRALLTQKQDTPMKNVTKQLALTSLDKNPSPPDSLDGQSIILKTDVLHHNIHHAYSYKPSLFREAQRYCELHELQGSIIPEFTGFYEIAAVQTGTSACFLILEDCGEPLGDFEDMDESDEDLKIDIFELVLAFHRKGYVHNDISSRNILQRQDGALVIIDLEEVEAHNCQLTGNDVTLGDFQPLITEFGCEELFLLAMALNFWLPATIDINGIPFFLRTLEQPHFAESLVRMFPEDQQETLASKMAHIASLVKEIRQGSNTVPVRVLSPDRLLKAH